MPKELLLVGEPMALLIAQEMGSLQEVETYRMAVAGAEFNVAVGLRRLGHAVRYCARLGRDPFGGLIARRMAAEGLDTEGLLWTDDAPTGIMFKAKAREGDPDIHYRRRGSAAAGLAWRDLEALDFTAYGFLHLTGILPALSPSCRDAAFRLVAAAKAAGATVCLDPNLRPQLWDGEADMAACVNALAYEADYFLPGAGEGERLMGSRDPEAIAAHYRARGTGTVIVKNGDQPTYAQSEGERLWVPAYPVERVVDTVGAGDGFAVGVLSAMAEGLPLAEAVRRGNAIGSLQVGCEGDNEGLPTRERLQAWMGGQP